MYLDPQVKAGVAGLEVSGDSRIDRTTVFDIETRAPGFREGLPDIAAQQRAGSTLQQPLGLAVDVGEAPVGIQGEEPVGDALQGGGETLGQPRDLGAQPALLGDVLGRALRPQDAPRLVVDRLADHPHPDVAPARGDHLELLVEGGAIATARREALAQPLAVMRSVVGDGLIHRRLEAGGLVVDGTDLVGPDR